MKQGNRKRVRKPEHHKPFAPLQGGGIPNNEVHWAKMHQHNTKIGTIPTHDGSGETRTAQLRIGRRDWASATGSRPTHTHTCH